MVLRYIYNNQGTTRLRVFKYHVLPQVADDVPPTGTWLSVSELDGQMLFLGQGCSRSIEVAQFEGFEGSTIYFPDDRFDKAAVSFPAGPKRRGPDLLLPLISA